MTWQYHNPKFVYQRIFDDKLRPWIGHQLFAYDLIINRQPKTIVELGTHQGTSIFSFCQAIKDSNWPAEIYAIDTWQGDINCGNYGEEILASVKKTIADYYGDLKINLLQMAFDEAVMQFTTKSIDLLHIDGCHSYEAVKNDFNKWHDKLADNGIILFHDIMVDEPNYGVYRLWQELKEKFATLEFQHSYGLGVLFMNPEMAEAYIAEQAKWQRYYAFRHESALRTTIYNELSDKEHLIKNLLEKYQAEDELIKYQQEQLLAIKNSLTWKIQHKFDSLFRFNGRS